VSLRVNEKVAECLIKCVAIVTVLSECNFSQGNTMTTISKLYPILRKTGLEDHDIQEFIEIVEESVIKGLVTKEDLKDTKVDIKDDIKQAEIRLSGNLHATEIRLIKWVFGLMLAQTSITIAVLKLL
jgi:hypothetical protein